MESENGKQLFGDRLRKIIADLRYSGNAFSKVIEQGNSKLYQIMRNDVSPSVKFCEIIYNHFPQINFDYLITGRGNPFLNKEEISENAPSLPHAEKNVSEIEEKDSYMAVYRELYKQCRELTTAKDHIIELQQKRIKDLEEKK